MYALFMLVYRIQAQKSKCRRQCCSNPIVWFTGEERTAVLQYYNYYHTERYFKTIRPTKTRPPRTRGNENVLLLLLAACHSNPCAQLFIPCCKRTVYVQQELAAASSALLCIVSSNLLFHIAIYFVALNTSLNLAPSP